MGIGREMLKGIVYGVLGISSVVSISYSVNGLISSEWNIYKQKDAVHKILEKEDLRKTDSIKNLEKIIETDSIKKTQKK